MKKHQETGSEPPPLHQFPLLRWTGISLLHEGVESRIPRAEKKEVDVKETPAKAGIRTRLFSALVEAFGGTCSLLLRFEVFGKEVKMARFGSVCLLFGFPFLNYLLGV